MEHLQIEESLNHHLEEKHPNLHSKNLKCLIYGGLDGIITTFAIISSCFGANMTIKTILILGFSNVIADALSMGLGEYISSDLERDYINSELEKEEYEYNNNLDEEVNELSNILQKNDNIDSIDSRNIVVTLSKYKVPFLELMLKKELDLEMPESRSNIITGSIYTFSSFIFFGSIPLIPYIISLIVKADETLIIFIISYICSIFSVILLGFLYVRKTKQTLFYLLKFAISATLAAGSAFSVGYILENLLK